MTLARSAACLALLLSAALPAQTGQAAKGMQTPVTDHGVSVNGKPLASPPASAEVQLSGKSLMIKYNTPSMRGREIFGGLVPYGKVWRTGANPATSFTTTGDIMVGDLRVPAGSYTLYSLPAQGTWQLIVNKQTGQWGTVYDQAKDLGRSPMQSKAMPVPQEVMSITFENTTMKGTELHIRWAGLDEYVSVRPVK